jgi:galactokinase
MIAMANEGLMFRIESHAQTNTQIALSDTAPFIQSLNELPADLHHFFSPSREVCVTRAPGRLDLMGGIADYSGSLVLQLPIASATHVALQRTTDRQLQLISLPQNAAEQRRFFEMSLDDFYVSGEPLEYAPARARFTGDDHWAAYAAGAFLVLIREKGEIFPEGARILIRSNVPEGKGVSSSAALEVAVMTAVAAAFNISIAPRELALLCQRVENMVAGAPCGVMDQMTSSCGEKDRLLALLCQPGELRGTIELPEELAVWGIDSGIRHAVSGADYGTIRTAAFMGYRIIAEVSGLSVQPTEQNGLVIITDDRWSGFLANVTPSEFAQDFSMHIPEQISGAQFLAQYGGITDAVCSVDPYRLYPVRAATRHPIYEHARVKEFAKILNNWGNGKPHLLAVRLGELMFASHDSYSACGLGSTGTDALVDLVRAAGPESGLYGAKITGGGSGGTVAVLGRRGAQEAVQKVVSEYAQGTHQPLLISGSSPGASSFGHLKLVKGDR